MVEGQLILATTAQRFDPALAPGQRIDTTALITLNPKYGMKMIPRLRSQPTSFTLGPVFAQHPGGLP
jgi:hypothetical protein